MNNEQVLNIMLGNTESIYQLRTQYEENSQKIEELSELMKDWENQQINDILEEKNEDGKPYFSNETKRNIALQDRKNDSFTEFNYPEKKATIRSLKQQNAKIIIDVEKLKNVNRAYETFSRI